MAFNNKSFAFGQAGESIIANYFKYKNYLVLPVYEKILDTGKGPQIFSLSGNLIAPDLFVFGQKQEKVWWIEAKHKSAFTWHRITGRWTTGIDIRHYADYLKVQEQTPWPVWLLFLQRDGCAKDTPEGKIGPTGLYGGSLEYLKENENHRHDNWGPSGMVYWSEETLRKIAELDEVLKMHKEMTGKIAGGQWRNEQ